MAELLGFLAGSGMLALVAALVIAFLKEMNWVSAASASRAGRTVLICAGTGLCYLLFSGLYFQVFHSDTAGTIAYDTLFQGPYIQGMAHALEQPAHMDALSMLFAWAGHLAGQVLFGQYRLAGLYLAWGITAVSLTLIQSRLTQWLEEDTVQEFAFLLLCVPGGILFLLPGSASLVLLLFSILFYFLGKRLPGSKRMISFSFSGWVIAFLSMLSAAFTIGMINGRIG